MKHKWEGAQWGVTYHSYTTTPIFYMATHSPGSAWLRIEELPVRRYLMVRDGLGSHWVTPWGAPAWATIMWELSEPEDREDWSCIHIDGIAWVHQSSIETMARSPP